MTKQKIINVEKKVFLPYPIELVWNVVTNNEDYSWRSDLKNIDILNETDFIEYTLDDFATLFHITKKEPFRCYEFDLENKNIKGHWIGKFETIDLGTRFILIEQIEVNSFLMRLLAKPYLKKQQHLYIENLSKKLKEEN